ncbi:L-fucose:H+ symporter permease [Aeromonas hydrophila]|uniref:L-fucose:H+ symporter permease n=1 Tax=Aeromonas hydrophila TaxID=644 RepID=UPI0024411958|nr:L-fucose:H+ symporter permease [Aeromonas hydrophila]
MANSPQAAVCENSRDDIAPESTGISHQVVPRSILIPFMLLTSCFALWGLANNMTDVLIAQFKKVFTLTDMQSGLVQTAFYGAYFCLALPAALFIKRFSYKAGVLLGLGLFCTGALMFYPASQIMTYGPFLASLFVLAGGLSILETSANPYIIAMGPQETATRRLNLAQSFNPIGSITGVLIGKFYILSQLNPATDAERVLMSADELGQIQTGELAAVMGPYVVVALVIVAVWLAIAFTRMPVAHDDNNNGLDLKGSFARLLAKRHFVRGVLGQFFYVGAQIGCWSYTIRYVMTEVGGNEADASTYLLASIVLFSACRFVCTALMKFISPRPVAGSACRWRSALPAGGDDGRRYGRCLRPDWRVGLYVADVPHHFWTLGTWSWQGHPVWWQLSHHGHPGRRRLDRRHGANLRHGWHPHGIHHSAYRFYLPHPLRFQRPQGIRIRHEQINWRITHYRHSSHH